MDLPTLLILLCCCILVKANVCVQRSPCSCVFSNGTGIDLAQSAATPVFTSSEDTRYEGDFPAYISNKQTFFFHPCNDTLVEDSCVGFWSICRYYKQLVPDYSSGVYTTNYSGYEVVGTVSHSHFATDADGIYIHYTWPSSTKVYLYCDEGTEMLIFRRMGPEVQLEFFSRNACLQQLEAPISEQSLSRWMEMQWTKVTQAIKEGYAGVVDGLKWLLPQPLERMPSFLGRM